MNEDKELYKSPNLYEDYKSESQKEFEKFMKEPELYIKQNNISDRVNQFIITKLQGEEVQLPIICQLSKWKINIPVRHKRFQMLRCIFDLESWMECFQQRNRYTMNILCPVCKIEILQQEVGVDYNLYHALEALKLFKKQYCKINPNKYIEDNFLYFQASFINPIYWIKIKDGKKEDRYEKVVIPGTYAIFGVQKRELSKGLSNIPQKKKLSEDLWFTIQKLSSQINLRLYKISKDRKISFTELQKQIEPKRKEIGLLFRQSISLISLGKKSLKHNFIFALKKIYRDQDKFNSLLIIYFVYYDVWKEYYLEINKNPIDILEQQLCIKEFRDENEHYLYIIGGKHKIDKYKQSSQFLRILIPNNPYENKEIKIEILQNLPIEGYNFMGTVYQDQVYVFYGQRQIKNQENIIMDESLNAAYAFKINKWEKININLEKRFDGSFFTFQDPIFDKIVIFFGGLSHVPAGLFNPYCEQQNRVQIFSCKEETLLGNEQKHFKLQFSKRPEEQYQQKVLCFPVFSSNYYDRNQLILSGQYLRKLLFKDIEVELGKRQIFTLDWENGVFKLNEMFSLEPPEYILTMVKKENREPFSPVDDKEGCIAYGNFYAIFNSENENAKDLTRKNCITQLLRFDLTNGQFRIHQYQDNNKSIEKSKEKTENFENRENLII